MSNLKKGWRVAAVWMLSVIPAVAVAARAENAFRISLTVLSACNVQTQMAGHGASFGAIDMSCTKDTPAAVYINGVLAKAEQRQAHRVLSNGQPLSAPSAHQTVTGNSKGEEVVDVVY